MQCSFSMKRATRLSAKSRILPHESLEIADLLSVQTEPAAVAALGNLVEAVGESSPQVTLCFPPSASSWR